MLSSELNRDIITSMNLASTVTYNGQCKIEPGHIPAQMREGYLMQLSFRPLAWLSGFHFFGHVALSVATVKISSKKCPTVRRHLWEIGKYFNAS